MPIAMLLERLVASKGAGCVRRLRIEQQNGANRSICCLLLESPQLGACSQPPSTSCPSPPLISAMQTAQQHARGSGARPALSLLTASRATPSRHAPGAVAEQEVLLDPLQRLAGIGELVAALRSLRFCSASAFSCFFFPPGHLAAPPRSPASPAPEQGGCFTWPFVCAAGRHMPASPAPQAPGPPGPL